MIDYKEGIPIKVEERLRNKKKEEKEILSRQGITERRFRAAVRKSMRGKKLSFTLAVYQTFEEFLKREMEKTGVVLACKKGCSTCCSQMITCTEMEIDEVIKFIKGNERRIKQKLIWEVRKGIGKWKKYFGKNAHILQRNPYQFRKDWQGKTCIFLKRIEGACNIYPVRIMDCRTTTSLTPCDWGMKSRIFCELDWSGPGRMRFQCEDWANNMIMNEQKRKLGHMAVSPILHWLTVKEREFY